MSQSKQDPFVEFEYDLFRIVFKVAEALIELDKLAEAFQLLKSFVIMAYSNIEMNYYKTNPKYFYGLLVEMLKPNLTHEDFLKYKCSSDNAPNGFCVADYKPGEIYCKFCRRSLKDIKIDLFQSINQVSEILVENGKIGFATILMSRSIGSTVEIEGFFRKSYLEMVDCLQDLRKRSGRGVIFACENSPDGFCVFSNGACCDYCGDPPDRW